MYDMSSIEYFVFSCVNYIGFLNEYFDIFCLKKIKLTF